MKYTKDEYLRLGRTLQQKVSEDLPDDIIKYTIVAIKFSADKYKTLYKVKQCYDFNAYECETIIHEIHEFHSYQETLDYLNSIGFNIDELNSAKGLKIPF